MNRAASIVLDGIDFSKLKDSADFGKGFYTTDCYELAKMTALARYKQEKQANGSAYPPVVLRINIKCDDLTSYNIRAFVGDTINWKRFICNNRWYDKIDLSLPGSEHNIDSRYDIVIGLTADGKMPVTKRRLEKNNFCLTDEIANEITPFLVKKQKHNGNVIQTIETKAYQISFHNPDFIKTCIKFKDYDIILLEKGE